MTNINEDASWPENIRQIQRGELVAGGPDGVVNLQAAQLANRTQYLKRAFGSVSAAEGFQYIGQAPSFVALRQIVPTFAGQHILLESHGANFTASGWSPRGGGQFVAVAGPGVDDGGVVAAVNDAWHWVRVYDRYLTPEMFGAKGDLNHDDAPAINLACNSARALGIAEVRGDGGYLIKSQIFLRTVLIPSPTGTGGRISFNLRLNTVIVDGASWPDVPAKWWLATPAFLPFPGDIIEKFGLYIDCFDGGGKAHVVATDGGAISTSHIYVGYCRNHIIVWKNFGLATRQSGLNVITGDNWELGYIAALNGTPRINSQLAECTEFNIRWCADHRYGGLSLMNHSNYAKVYGGCIDFNGKWTSLLTLTNVTSTSESDVIFGDDLLIGTKACSALSPLMLYQRNWCLVVTESANKLNGISDYAVGDTVSFGNWSAKIAAIKLCSDQVAYYHDIVLGLRTGDVGRCTITPNYLGGIVGHHLADNFILAMNPAGMVDITNMRGLSTANGLASCDFYNTHVSDTPFMSNNQNGLFFNKTVQLGFNGVYGIAVYYNGKQNVPVNLATFGAPKYDIRPDYYDIIVGSSIKGQFARATLRCDGTEATLEFKDESHIGLTVSGYTLYATNNGSDSTLTLTATKRTA